MTTSEDAGAGSPEDFFTREQKFIQDYSQGLGVNFSPGSGWGVDPETGQGTYDLNFFTEQGYSRAQSQFATAHELDHVKELGQLLSVDSGMQLYQERKALREKKQRIRLTDNCLRDLADDRRVLTDLPSLRGEAVNLYKDKLFPDQDLTRFPKHLQFPYAILREGVVGEQSIVDPIVAEEINALRHFKRGGRERDILEIVTDPKLPYDKKLKLFEKFIDPVIEKLFEEDKQESKEQPQEGQQEGQATSGDEEAPFKSFYQEYDQNNPQPLNEEQQQQAKGEQGGPTQAERQQAAYEKENKVSLQDSLEYKKEYQKIEPYIEPNRQQYRRIIAERLTPKRKLVGFKDEGVMIAPGLAAIAQESFDAGVVDPTVFMDFEGRIIKKIVPRVWEATGLFDRSGSMDIGGKKEEQRRAAILLMESLAEFMNLPEVRHNMLNPQLAALSEVRSFGGSKQNVIIKPLSAQLTEKQRVEVFKALNDCSGSATEDYIGLGQIIEEMKARELQEPGYLKRVLERDILKLILVFSDGASSNETQFNERKAELEKMGVKVVSYRGIRDGVKFTPQMAKILEETLNDLCYPK